MWELDVYPFLFLVGELFWAKKDESWWLLLKKKQFSIIEKIMEVYLREKIEDDLKDYGVKENVYPFLFLVGELFWAKKDERLLLKKKQFSIIEKITFGDSIAAQLLTFSEVERCSIKHEINDILFNYQMKKFQGTHAMIIQNAQVINTGGSSYHNLRYGSFNAS